MTMLTTRQFDQAPRSRVGLTKRPLWLVSGQLGVIIALFIGFGARGRFTPKVVVLALVCCLVGMIGFGPERRLNRIIVSAPVVAISSWWMASYLWTFNVFGWWTDTQLVMPFVVACVVFAGVLPSQEFRAALVAGCYVAIAYTVLELIIHPGSAMVNPDLVPGWRGGFIHKNTMGPFMVFAILVLSSFDRRSWRRRIAIVVALGLIAMSQSTTALGAGLITLLICVFLRRLAASTGPARASLVVGALGLAVVAGVLSSSVFPAVLGLSGKDATLTGRTEVWEGVWGAIQKRPWQGYGAGGVWSDPSNNPGRSIMRDLGFTVFHSHNGFLEILLLLGIVGLGLFVWLMVSTVRLGLVLLSRDTPMAVCAIGFVVLIVVVSISEVVVLGVWLGMLCTFQSLMVRTNLQRRLEIEIEPASA